MNGFRRAAGRPAARAADPVRIAD